MTYGIGMAGSGFMGRTWSEAAVNHVADTHLAGVAIGRRAEKLAADYGVPLHADFDEMLANPDVDIVVLATPPAVHLEEVLAAAAAGKHILVEKPMAQNVDECRQMTAACIDAGVTMSVVSQQRFRGVPGGVKRLIDEGAIGEVRMMRIIGPSVGFWDTSVTQDEWKLDPNQQTAFASWGAHACDLARWYSGSTPVHGFAYIDHFDDTPPPMSSAMASYRFASGAMAQIWMSYDIPEPGLGGGLQIEVVGSSGIIQADAFSEIRLGNADGWSVEFTMPDFDPTDATDPVRLGAYKMQVQDLVDAIDEGRPPMVDGPNGTETIAMIDAAELSASTGNGIPIVL